MFTLSLFRVNPIALRAFLQGLGLDSGGLCSRPNRLMAAWVPVRITPWHHDKLDIFTSAYVFSATMHSCATCAWHLRQASVASEEWKTCHEVSATCSDWRSRVLGGDRNIATSETTVKTKKCPWKSCCLFVTLLFVVYSNLVKWTSLIRHSDLMLKTSQHSVHPFSHKKKSLMMASFVEETQIRSSKVAPNLIKPSLEKEKRKKSVVGLLQRRWKTIFMVG